MLEIEAMNIFWDMGYENNEAFGQAEELIRGWICDMIFGSTVCRRKCVSSKVFGISKQIQLKSPRTGVSISSAHAYTVLPA